MPVTRAALDDPDLDERPAVLRPVNAREEDAFWERAHCSERYFNPGLDYEDYAPAYCVGYIGYAQYGGDYAEAEKSLWANWQRIKGGSRLSVEQARLAMRAAWDRMALRVQREAIRKVIGKRMLRQRLGMPSFKLHSSPLR